MSAAAAALLLAAEVAALLEAAAEVAAADVEGMGMAQQVLSTWPLHTTTCAGERWVGRCGWQKRYRGGMQHCTGHACTLRPCPCWHAASSQLAHPSLTFTSFFLGAGGAGVGAGGLGLGGLGGEGGGGEGGEGGEGTTPPERAMAVALDCIPRRAGKERG